MEKTLAKLQEELILSSQRGYPILIAGALYMLVLSILPSFLAMNIVHLIWVVGLGCIFPVGILIGKLLKVEVITKGNVLGTLGGLGAGVQAAYIPIFIIMYKYNPEWLPLTIGLLGGSHFFIYAWIYRSKAYSFLTITTCVYSLLAGSMFLTQAFVVVPLGICIIYTTTVFWLIRENKQTEKLPQT